MKIITNKSDLEIVKLAREIRIKNSVLIDLKIKYSMLRQKEDFYEKHNVLYDINKSKDNIQQLRNRLNQIINE